MSQVLLAAAAAVAADEMSDSVELRISPCPLCGHLTVTSTSSGQPVGAAPAPVISYNTEKTLDILQHDTCQGKTTKMYLCTPQTRVSESE